MNALVRWTHCLDVHRLRLGTNFSYSCWAGPMLELFCWVWLGRGDESNCGVKGCPVQRKIGYN